MAQSQKSTEKEILSTTRRGFLSGVAATMATLALPEIGLPKLSGFAVPVNEYLIRSTIWTQQIREALLDDLISMKFTDGDSNV